MIVSCRGSWYQAGTALGGHACTRVLNDGRHVFSGLPHPQPPVNVIVTRPSWVVRLIEPPGSWDAAGRWFAA
jgi:hypothetical protein